jgi:hypothetical protein
VPDKLFDFFAWREVSGQRVIYQDGVGRRDTFIPPNELIFDVEYVIFIPLRCFSPK